MNSLVPPTVTERVCFFTPTGKYLEIFDKSNPLHAGARGEPVSCPARGRHGLPLFWGPMVMLNLAGRCRFAKKPRPVSAQWLGQPRQHRGAAPFWGSGRARDAGRWEQRRARREALQRRCQAGDSRSSHPAQSPALIESKTFLGCTETAWQRNTNEDA